MALLPILEFPDPRLRTKAALIEAAEVTTPAFQELIDNMFLTMYDAPGIGLAATQVDVHSASWSSTSAKKRMNRMCSSTRKSSPRTGPGVPGRLPVGAGHLRRRDPRRHHHREVPGPQRPGTAAGGREVLATCIQHEMDHLDGKLFIDYLSPLKREMVRKKLAKQRKHVA
jgi:peptide deformylase